jgi:hypothetical protein
MSLLVLAASGDDFNLLRVALPSAWVGIPLGSVLEDDANADFLRSDQDTAPRPNAGKASDTPALAYLEPGSGCPALDGCRQPAATPFSAPSRTALRTPLRC